MYCPSCGNPVSEDTKFCEKCGAPITEAAEPNRSETVQQTVRPSEVSQKIKDAVEKLDLSQIQKTTAIIAAASALIALICITGTVASWITAIASLLLTYLCVKKYDFSSKAMVIAFSVFAARFLWLDFSNIVDGGIHYSFFVVWSRLVTYGCVAVYWLIVLGQFKKKGLGSSLFLLGLGMTALYAFVKMLTNVTYGFRNVIFYLGWIGFIAVYAILILTDGETVPYIKGLFAGGTNTYKPVGGYAQYCPRCGSGQPAEATFCDKCGSKLGGEQTEVSEPVIRTVAEQTVVEEQPDHPIAEPETPTYVMCQQCGNKLAAGSLFCDICGTALTVPVPETENTVVGNRAPSAETSPAEQEVIPVAHTVVCPTCGNILEEGSRFCDTCGTAISQPDGQKQTSAIPQKLFCPQCGHELESGSLFCDFCGTKLQ